LAREKLDDNIKVDLKKICVNVKYSTNFLFSKPSVDICVSALEIQILLPAKLVDLILFYLV
jgi:hypothetical protein